MNEAPSASSGALKTTKPFPWTWIVLAVVVCVPILFIGYVISVPLRIVYEADAGFRTAEKTIDPEKLRGWALESIRNYPGTNGYSEEIPLSKIPDYIASLYSIAPESALVVPKSSGREAYVCVIWGGGFFHWGFNIGGTNYSIESFDDHVTAEWTNGIYYSHEGNRKIK